MKNSYLITSFILLLYCSVNAQQPATSQQPENYFELRKVILKQLAEETKDASGTTSNEKDKDDAYAKFMRLDYFMAPRVFPTGNYFNPQQVFNEFSKYGQAHSNEATTRDNEWSAVGPFTPPYQADLFSTESGLGRVNCVAVHPTDDNIIFIGTASGGIWKSKDGGQNWIVCDEHMPSMSISDIVFNPIHPDTIYAATGDAPLIFLLDYYSVPVTARGSYSSGIMMSADGGLTWQQTSLNPEAADHKIYSDLIIHPTQPGIVLASGYDGIMRSTDGGANWNNVSSSFVYDLQINPLNPSVMYAMESNRFMRSNDAGATWFQKYNFTGTGYPTFIGLSSADTNYVYLLRGSGKLYRSTNGGTAFSNAASFSNSYFFELGYTQNIAVSPVNANRVYLGLVDLLKSEDGGTTLDFCGSTYEGDSSLHVDFHDFYFDKTNPQKMYACNDGGIYISQDGGNTWITISNGINMGQYYSVATSINQPGSLLAGAQDNSVHFTADGQNWKVVTCCDGMAVLYDYADENIAYAATQSGQFSRSNDGGNSFTTSITPPGFYGGWVAPIVMNPVNHNSIFIANTEVYASYNNGDDWEIISPTLSTNWYLHILEAAASDSNVLYAGAYDALAVTFNHGQTWTHIENGLPISSAAISNLAISDTDPLTAWVTLSGFSEGNKVFVTHNGGQTWENVSGTLPNVPVNCIVQQHNTNNDLYIGTDYGVFYKNDLQADWTMFSSNLPSVIISAFEFNYRSGKLYASTHGRGIYVADPVTPIAAIVNDASISQILSPQAGTYCDNLSSQLIVEVGNYGTDTLNSVNLYYAIDGGAPVGPFYWTGALSSTETAIDTIALLNFTPGKHSIQVYTVDPNNVMDEYQPNDLRSISLDVDSVIVLYPIQESFEPNAFPPLNWSISGGGGLWSRTFPGGFGQSSNSARANFYNVVSGHEDLVTMRVDLTGVTPPAYIGFSHAYAPFDPALYVDTLSIAASNDCGETWNTLYSKWDADLFTVFQNVQSEFVPSLNQWVTEYIDITSYIGSVIKVRFRAGSGWGNYLYVDDINIYNGVVAVEEIAKNEIGLFPNPSTGIFYLDDPAQIVSQLKVYDSQGRQVLSMQQKEIGNAIDLSTFSDGLYLINLFTSKEQLQKKLVVQH